MKTNFLLILTTAALIFSAFLTFQPKLKNSINVDKYQQTIKDKAPNKQEIENKLDKRGCNYTAEYQWCESLQKCLLKNEICPTTIQKPTYSYSECQDEGGTVRKSDKCLREEEKLGNINSSEGSICCVPIRGRI